MKRFSGRARWIRSNLLNDLMLRKIRGNNLRHFCRSYFLSGIADFLERIRSPLSDSLPSQQSYLSDRHG